MQLLYQRCLVRIGWVNLPVASSQRNVEKEESLRESNVVSARRIGRVAITLFDSMSQQECVYIRLVRTKNGSAHYITLAILLPNP